MAICWQKRHEKLLSARQIDDGAISAASECYGVVGALPPVTSLE